jgi:hypothetical protein
MTKSPLNFDTIALAELHATVEDVKTRLSKNAANKIKAEERIVSLKEEGIALEAELRTRTADLEVMVRKGVANLTKKGNVSADLVGILLKMPADDGQA